MQGPAAPDASLQQPPVAPFDEGWERVARLAEDLAMRPDASLFAVNRVRADLVMWRDAFHLRTRDNAARLATVNAQIAALGAVPETGEEAPDVATRRAALAEQRRALAAPGILAAEAHARADGLIREFDARLLQRQTAELTKRGPSPLNPVHLGGAVAAVWNAVSIVGVEIAAGLVQGVESGRLQSNLPRAVALFVVAVGLLWFVRRWITTWRSTLETRAGKLMPVWMFTLSLAQIAVPVLGLVALRLSLETLDIFGLRSSLVVAAIPSAGFAVVFAWWLGGRIFPSGVQAGYLGYDRGTRRLGRAYSLTLAWIMAIGSLFDAALQTIETDPGVRAAIEWPVLAVMGVVLWQLGHVIRRKPEEIEGQTVSQGRLRDLVGQLCILIAVVAPLVAALGYGAAGRALMVPAIMSLALIGLLLAIQRLVHDVSRDDINDENNKGAFALLPVLISFLIYILSLPLFALIWGARVDDLEEQWTRFGEGFALGESRISPGDFLTFAIVFALGYLLTRFIQGSLRKSVLPRTRLDLGGQNAIVAGFGYLGIILAAIIAITSAGIDLSSLAIVAGALSVGIGFGLQNIVSNFVSGIILLIERPVSEGDWIEVGGKMGYVRAISVRSTRIETFDRTDVIVPNADLVSNQVINWTRGNLIGRVILSVGVAYGSDVDKVTNILREIAEAHPMVLMTPPPAVLFMGFGASSLDFEIRAILRDVNYIMNTKSEINHEIAKRFAAEGIEIPFAQHDIWLRNPEALKESKA
ncbi:MAG: mechanosensitive ion channel family protein [Yoonia sp.]|nr:mechanosensitive ion channel family protein [Yoonia sp.]